MPTVNAVSKEMVGNCFRSEYCRLVMAGEDKTANKYFVNYGKNTEKNLDRTREGHPTPR